MSQPTIDIAIVGGGIGGLCLAINLLKIASLRVHIYEAAHTFSEIGAGINLGPNSARVIKVMDPRLYAIFLELSTSNMDPSDQTTWQEYFFAESDLPADKICTASNEIGQKSLHRAKFLNRLVTLFPPENITFAKRLHSLTEDANERVTMTFEDGSTSSADCVVGADGLNSKVRRHLFCDDESGAKQYEPKFANVMAYRTLVPMDEARAALGDEIARSAIILLARKTLAASYPIDFGETLNLVLCESDVPHVESMAPSPADFAHVQKTFASWSPRYQTLVRLLDNPRTMAWPLFELPRLPTYARSRVCVMGDAAHAMGPFIGAGAGQAIEDAYTLATIFALVKTPEDIPAALKAFDLTRRPRCEYVMDASHQAGEIYSLRDPGCGEDMEKLRQSLSTRLKPVWEIDVEAMAEEAKANFYRFQKMQG